MSDYRYQFRSTATWQDAKAPWSYAGSITDVMQQAGLRYSEIAGLLDDIRDGHILTAEDGTQFRAVPQATVTNAEIREATAPGYHVTPGSYGSDVGKWLAYGPGGWIVSRRATWQEAAADTQAALARSEGRGWAVAR